MPEAPTYRNALPLGSMLLEYRLESVLGAGGFGMTYLGWDANLEKHVAIKEYLPGELAIRALDGSLVPVNTDHEYNYKWGLDRFIQEARTLAKFSHPNIVRVNRYFEANGTGYMVMDYEAGESLHRYLRSCPMPDEAALRNILMPILDGLQAVHQAGFLHRDIKPSNVFIRKNGSPVLIDFGSARLAADSISKSLTTIVSPGYAPLEQYTSKGNQGPWSDIYALASVIYRAVTGENPPDAVSRMKSDTVPAALAAARTRYSERFLRAIGWGLSLDEKLRPQNVAEWREVFLGRMPTTALNRMSTTAAPRATPVLPTQPSSQAGAPAGKAVTTVVPGRTAPAKMITPKRWRWIRNGAILAALGLAVGAYFQQHSQEHAVQSQVVAQNADESGVERAIIRRFEAADADRSGDLDRSEFAGGFPRYAGRFDEADDNRDGRMSLRELEVFLEREGLAQAGAKAGPQVDSGGDTPPASAPAAEPEQAVKPQSEAPAPRSAAAADIPAGKRRAIREAFDRADADKSGDLSREEVRDRMPQIAGKFDLIDTNRDGRISREELWQFRKSQQARKATRP